MYNNDRSSQPALNQTDSCRNQIFCKGLVQTRDQNLHQGQALTKLLQLVTATTPGAQCRRGVRVRARIQDRQRKRKIPKQCSKSVWAEVATRVPKASCPCLSRFQGHLLHNHVSRVRLLVLLRECLVTQPPRGRQIVAFWAQKGRHRSRKAQKCGSQVRPPHHLLCPRLKEDEHRFSQRWASQRVLIPHHCRNKGAMHCEE